MMAPKAVGGQKFAGGDETKRALIKLGAAEGIIGPNGQTVAPR